MALLKKTRSAQTPLVAEFVFNFDDTMVDVAGVTKTLGSVYTDAGNFEVIPLPVNAEVIGGEVQVQVQGVGPTAYSVNVGDSGSATKYASAVSLLGAVGARTALTLTAAAINASGLDIRMAVTSSVANATAGKWVLRVMYVIRDRATEVAST